MIRWRPSCSGDIFFVNALSSRENWMQLDARAASRTSSHDIILMDSLRRKCTAINRGIHEVSRQKN